MTTKKNKKKYIFDVDGTLTPSRGILNREYAETFVFFARNHDCYLVTGSDRPKTLEQVGTDVYNVCQKVYNCSGNDVWIQDQNIRTNHFILSDEMKKHLNRFLEDSKFYVKTGNHIEVRPGLCNFSIVGRNCSLEERAMYRQWDEHKNERAEIAKKLSWLWPDYDIKVAGETGLDIVMKGQTKAQILSDFDLDDELYFFGDRTKEGGNDHDIALKIIERGGVVYQIDKWSETFKILSNIF